MTKHRRFSQPMLAEGGGVPVRRTAALPSERVRAVLLSDFLTIWQGCLAEHRRYTLQLPDEIPDLAITVDERRLAYLLTQYGVILTAQYRTDCLRASLSGSRAVLALLRLAVLRIKNVLRSTSLSERRKLLESSLQYMGIKLAYEETPSEIASLCMIPCMTPELAGLAELVRADAVGIARAVEDALRDILPLLDGV